MNAREFAERSLLGVLLVRPGRIDEVADWLRPEDFSRLAHQTIYRELRDMVTEAGASARVDPYEVAGVDPVALYHRIQARGELGDSAITAPALFALIQTAPDPSTAQPAQYGLMVLEASIRRAIEQDGLRIGQLSATAVDLEHMLAAVEDALSEVEDAQQRWQSVAGPRVLRLL